jgi:2-phospho-L-lactate/phosphoenolpyruvate guanylyltransferase
MRVLAVPVKLLERAKGRLAPLLTPLERAVITLAMLEDVLDACLAQPGWETWVISADEAVLEVGARRGARPFAESGRSLLGALAEVEPSVRGRSSELAVVLADLPLLSAGALSTVLAIRASVVAAPAASDGGTNLLVRRPARVIPGRFGPDSFARHRWAARRARVSFEEADAPELAFDLDRPADVAALLDSGSGRRTLAACHEMGLPGRLRQRA